MTSRRRIPSLASAAFRLAPLAATLALAAAGCYNPAITSGAQKCDANGKCPEGFTCFPDQHCYAPGSNPSCSPACAGQTPKCDKASLKCVQCLADSDCPAGNLCVAKVCKPGCSAGHPGCAADAGACDVDLGVCRGCLSDKECSDGAKPRCDKPSGLCVPCLPGDDQCPVGQYCAGKDGNYACVAGCSTNDQCVKQAQQNGSDGGADKRVTCCDSKCVDVTSDAANCGRCGTACMNGGSCCNAGCVDTTTDLANCGGCGSTCAPRNVGVPACTGGACGFDKCTPGFGDCDGNTANGCETGLAADAKNCGACNNVCGALPNAQVVCAAGKCGVSGCSAGYANCNMVPGDGCEVSTGTDVKNCGACNNACPAPANSMAACAAGQCRFNCNANYGNCNNIPGDGCEAVLNNDVNNCGACGKVCVPGPNQLPGCIAGVCKPTCKPGFGDCDGNAANGCEVDFSSSPANCGACGKVCTVANGVAGCAASVCTVASCNAGWGDCNAVAADGCETSTVADAKNCGRCGNACGVNTPVCLNSVCGAVDLSGVFSQYNNAGRTVYIWKTPGQCVKLANYTDFCTKRGLKWWAPKDAADATLLVTNVYNLDMRPTWIQVYGLATTIGAQATLNGFNVTVDSPNCTEASPGGAHWGGFRKWACSMCYAESNVVQATNNGESCCWDKGNTYDWFVCQN